MVRRVVGSGWLALAACAPAVRLRDARTGVQHDRAGRAYVEARRIEAFECNGPARGGAAEAHVRARLSVSAQEQGYSGVVSVQCVHEAPSPCPGGATCTGIAVRYVDTTRSAEPVRGGACDPPCDPSARCQDGLCVAVCEPPCSDARTCVAAGRCERVEP